MSERSRKHKITLDLFDWEAPGSAPGRADQGYHAYITIDEGRLTDAIARAIGRHDGTYKLAGGGIVISVEPIAPGTGKAVEP